VSRSIPNAKATILEGSAGAPTQKEIVSSFGSPSQQVDADVGDESDSERARSNRIRFMRQDSRVVLTGSLFARYTASHSGQTLRAFARSLKRVPAMLLASLKEGGVEP
jgi:hypothetical protein